ncbi:hypothetical protein G6688_05025 [Polynucleobacter paneuropaeus]|nr:hypothetical protein G6688_05025 [Polynucleobacter paneuropaeus]
MKQLLSDQFCQHDHALKEVCRRHKFIVEPSWQHKWFYRYLQISLSYNYVHDCERAARSKIQKISDYKSTIADYDQVKFVESAFFGVCDIEFIRWWGIIGQFQFNQNDSYQNNVLETICFGKKYTQKDKSLMIKKYEEMLNNVISTPSHPDLLILSVPLNNSKENLIKSFTKNIEQYMLFPQNEVAFGNFFIKKSKLKEAALRDCFRTLEIKLRDPEITLIELAKKSGTLKTSLAGIKENSKTEFANTVRVGIKKQLDMAINLAENAARGVFPETKKIHGLNRLYSELHKVTSKDGIGVGALILNKIQKKSKYKSLNINEIIRHLKSLQGYGSKRNFDELKRLY